ncbi:Hypothetical predicted protein, partial [Prunus dulcis]
RPTPHWPSPHALSDQQGPFTAQSPPSLLSAVITAREALFQLGDSLRPPPPPRN